MKQSSNPQLEKTRKLVRTHLDLQLYSAALFWADKAATLSHFEPRDVYQLASCMFLLKQYQRAVVLIRNKGLDKTDMLCYYMVLRCLVEAKDFTEAGNIINSEINPTSCNVSLQQQDVKSHDSLTYFNVQSALFCIKGKIYEALDNRNFATDCYREALRNDVHCYDAFQALIQHQMLTSFEEQMLIQSLPWSNYPNDCITKPLYEVLLKKYQEPKLTGPFSQFDIPVELMMDNLDIQEAEAERHYYACAYKDCFQITQSVLKQDPYHPECLPIHIACLVELEKSNELFYLAHKLVDLQPDQAIAWFAVGCYYYLIGKRDQSRRYLGKATNLDNTFGPAWLAYGHSFAVENEHDQAMAAYFKASQLLKGCHLPLLYIGLECSLTNNIMMAQKYLKEALEMAPNDPFVLHELGVIAFQSHRYKEAESRFLEALERIKQIKQPIISNKWESLYNNLGHVYRKLQQYDKALEYHKQALVISPMNTSTLTCIGFVQSLSKNYADAVDTFHKALGQKREDTFSSTMLTCVLEMCIEEPPLFNDYLDEESAVVESGEGKKSKKLDRTLKMNDDNDVILPFRNSKLRLWNRRLRKKTEDSSTTMEDDSTAMVIDSSSTADNSSFNMDLSTNMSENSNSFK
ncbi:cell division cycle protein 16 homolog [Sipha flava]|uniref:Cell division cycle protein 16 n=1 Tax=Sipha flava TaxID=143950 RepID=A0A2S2R2Q1_9HEMI|nr:cell division cycle protein 16 homolog [Sipha flava]